MPGSRIRVIHFVPNQWWPVACLSHSTASLIQPGWPAEPQLGARKPTCGSAGMLAILGLDPLALISPFLVSHSAVMATPVHDPLGRESSSRAP